MMGTRIFSFILLLVLNIYANERIISLSPSITEIIFALDKGKELVGTSSYSLYPDEAKKILVVGSYTNPHLEKILALKPTLVVGQTFNKTTLEKLKHFGIKTIMLNLQTITSIKNSIKTLAEQLKTKKYEQLIKDIDIQIKNAKKSNNKHSVLIVYGLRKDLRSSIYVASKDIFFNQIIELCGNTNAYKDSTTSQPVLSYENIIALNPQQIIILHSHATQPNINIKEALDAWYKLPTSASKYGNISIVDEDYLHIPSHRVALSIKRLSKEMDKYKGKR
jgi:iron complex transport system substrate-binding protein